MILIFLPHVKSRNVLIKSIEHQGPHGLNSLFQSCINLLKRQIDKCQLKVVSKTLADIRKASTAIEISATKKLLPFCVHGCERYTTNLVRIGQFYSNCGVILTRYIIPFNPILDINSDIITCLKNNQQKYSKQTERDGKSKHLAVFYNYMAVNAGARHPEQPVIIS